MGSKGKGRDSGNAKKPKAAKAGHRPHEERQQQETSKIMTSEPAQRPPAERR